MKQLFASLLFIASVTYAMQENHTQIIECLSKSSKNTQWVLENNILNLENQDLGGSCNTLLHSIAETGNPELFASLGNKITSKVKNIKNYYQETPIDIINRKILESMVDKEPKLDELKKCAEYLNLNIGSFSQQYSYDSLKSLKYAVKNNKINFKIYDDQSNTYFHKLCAQSPFEQINLFMKYAPLFAYWKTNSYGKTPLQTLESRYLNLINSRNYDSKQAKKCKKLLSSFKKQQRKLEKKSTLESLTDNQELLYFCLEQKTWSFSKKSISGDTLLHKWAKEGRNDLIGTFLQFVTYSALKKKDKKGRTPEEVALNEYKKMISKPFDEETRKNYQRTINRLQTLKQVCDKNS